MGGRIKQKKVTVALKDLPKVCHACGEVKDDTGRRTYRAANYQGSCGDSFCWASCDLSSCKEIVASVCADCAQAGGVPEGRP